LADKGNSVIITLRNAVVDDRDRVLEWRNTDSTRKFFFDPTPGSWETHEAWFDSVLSAEHVYLLIGEVAGEPVGVLRYDVAGECADVSVYIVPGKTGLGLGTKLLAEGTVWLRCNVVGVRQLKARVVCENKASARAFEKAGYRCEFCEFTSDI
jgi:UDP-2,4-diacetamido-2,4,6-trideoxy-beta-L-altropyranose hydrolase